MTGLIAVYRVENTEEEHGLWRNFDGSPCDVLTKLTVGKARNLPMEDSDFYRFNGKRWFASTDAPEKLRAWFHALDIIQMARFGYRVYRFMVTEIRVVSEYEVVFTRDSIVDKVAIDPTEIWREIRICLR